MAEEQGGKKETKLGSFRMRSFTTNKKELQYDLEDLRHLQEGKHRIAKNYEARLKYDVELGENKFSLQELDLLKEDANVYKFVGPILVKQDPEKPNAKVRKRIGYLETELERVNAIIRDLREKTISKRKKISWTEQRLRSLESGKTNL